MQPLYKGEFIISSFNTFLDLREEDNLFKKKKKKAAEFGGSIVYSYVNSKCKLASYHRIFFLKLSLEDPALCGGYYYVHQRVTRS